MSNSQKKNDETNLSGIFSIQVNQASSGNIPGVSALLEVKNAQTRLTKNIPEATKTTVTRTNIPPPPPKTFSLQTIGVLFELRFQSEGSFFRFSLASGHKEPKLVPWQEAIYQKMKLDFHFFEIKTPFHEVRPEQNFIYDAFGIQPGHFIQVLSPGAAGEKIILISDQSLISKQSNLLEHFAIEYK